MYANVAVLDTNIVSFLMKNDPRVGAFTNHMDSHKLAITFITVGELFYGALKANWGEERISRLEEEIKKYLEIPYNTDVARFYGKVQAESKQKGRVMGINDAWIAACAMRYDVDLITHNVRHFHRNSP